MRRDRSRGGERGDQPALLIGPGERLRPLAHVLASLAPGSRVLADLAHLAERTSDEEIELVLDADELPLEDLGYLRRFLAEGGRTRIALVGDDSGTRVVRTILSLPRARWMPWPPVLDDLIGMSGIAVEAEVPLEDAPVRAARTFVEPRSPLPRRAVFDDDESDEDQDDNDYDGGDTDDEVDEIGAILKGERETPARDSAALVANADEPDFSLPVEDEPTTTARSARSATAASDEAGAPPPWWRAQIADLADTAQRVELGVQALRLTDPESDEDVRTHVDQLDAEVARLVQFARTLGYLAAPPARGDQVFELGDTVQVFVSQLAGRPEATPRCQFRSTEPVYVRSDRALLGQALDAFFWLAGACSKKGDLVRAQVVRDGGPAEVRLEFQSGPLEQVETARILEPYGLRRILPDLGPNALSAAMSIVVGQGGSAELVRAGTGRLAWRIVLPAVEAPSKKKSK